jgi:hypothetical protein
LNVAALILQVMRTALTVLSLLNAPPAFAQMTSTPALDGNTALYVRGTIAASPITRLLRP